MRMIIIAIIALLLPGSLLAAPSISSVSGTVANGQSITITGSGFGSKATAKPLLWADFESGTTAPTDLGTTTSWAAIQHMHDYSTNCHGGTHCIRGNGADDWGSTAVNVEVSLGSPTNSGKYYVSVWRKVSYTSANTPNIKFFRIWAAGYTVPDMFVSWLTAQGGIFSYVEACSTDSTHRQWLDWPYPGNTWRHEEYIWQNNSGTDAHDGSFTYYVDSADVSASPNTWDSNCAGSIGQPSYLSLENYESEHNVPADAEALFDSVYVDTTWQRVMICAGSTWTARGHCEVQVPSAWATGEITATVNRGSFAADATAYLYVVDATNTANTNGQAITFGSGAASATTLTGVSCRGCVVR